MKKYRYLFILIILNLLFLLGCDFNPTELVSEDNVEKEITEHSNKGKDISDSAYESFSEKNKSVYNQAVDEYVANEKNGQDEDTSLAKKILSEGYETYVNFRAFAPLALIVSVAVGVLLVIFSRHNKVTRRLGLYGFIIGLPCLIIFIVYGIGIACDMFLF